MVKHKCWVLYHFIYFSFCCCFRSSTIVCVSANTDLQEKDGLDLPWSGTICISTETGDLVVQNLFVIMLKLILIVVFDLLR